jgi:hypothetical protein
MRKFLLLFLVISISACESRRERIESILTNNHNGKYWDLLYETDIYGKEQEVSYNNQQNIETCLFLYGQGGISIYHYLDSNRIVNLNDLNGDIVYEGPFKVVSDNELSLYGDTCKISKLNSDSLELILSGKAIRIYVKSKNQNKTICKNIYCK